jgi:hypothetical protein
MYRFQVERVLVVNKQYARVVLHAPSSPPPPSQSNTSAGGMSDPFDDSGDSTSSANAAGRMTGDWDPARWL